MQNVLKRILTVLLMSLSLAAANAADGPVQVHMQTTAGAIVVELYPDKAPQTVANFLRYVDGGHYNGASFYRTVTFENDNGKPWIEVVQGGLDTSSPPFAPIAHESTAKTGLRHENGTISMGRDGVGTASSEFFICVGPQPALNHGAMRNEDGQGFSAFGKVIAGMDTVRRIHGSEADGEAESDYFAGQILSEPVSIISVRRVATDN
ncbi:MAG: peptidylprolyl isomerase [Woeseia sp.]|nr:peptidylprolyl isomerase [Woeseia sp.]MBT8097174.1 peptidylprolyl isomerase [Woeseia sp.]